MTKELVPLRPGLTPTRPPTPTLDRYSGIGEPLCYRRYLSPGGPLWKIPPSFNLGEGAHITRGELLAIIDELVRALRPVEPQRLAHLVERLIGAFPQARPPDCETYVAAMMLELGEFPEWVVEKAIRTVIRRNTFLPAVAELVALAEPEIRPLRWQRERARLMLDAQRPRALRA